MSREWRPTSIADAQHARVVTGHDRFRAECDRQAAALAAWATPAKPVPVTIVAAPGVSGRPLETAYSGSGSGGGLVLALIVMALPVALAVALVWALFRLGRWAVRKWRKRPALGEPETGPVTRMTASDYGPWIDH
jgi:hypothetical protein